MKKSAFLFLWTAVLFSCASAPCRIEDRKDLVMVGNEKISSSSKDMTKRIFVYKPDGSKQCESESKISLESMGQQLSKIEVFSSVNKHDGLMRPQVCGSPTGYCNVYEIDSKDLEAALKLGFKKWVRD